MLSKVAAAATRNIRLTVVLAVVLICGSFASAAVLQIRFDRTRAETQARVLEARHAQLLAESTGLTLNRYAALAAAFANAPESAATASALAAAGKPGLHNVAVLNMRGTVMSALNGVRPSELAIDEIYALGARTKRVALPSPDGPYTLVAMPYAGSILVLELNPDALLPAAEISRAALSTQGGTLLAEGGDWGAQGSLVAFHTVPNWPLSVGTSMTQSDAFGAWYGSLPLYLFVILGPALAGAALATVFVREFERRAKTAEAVRSLKSTRPAEARLLVRLADAERRAIEAERSKGEFIAHMSHELRTPLNAIIGFSEVIESGFFGPPGHAKYVEYAHDIGNAGRNLHSKIGDILEYASVEAGRYPIAYAETDVVVIARSAIEEVAGHTFARRVKLVASLPQCASTLTDASAVKRILGNLVANAAQFTPENGTVRVAVREEENAIVISVRDSGLGFSSREAKTTGKAFARFERTGAVSGLGLGLAIAMSLARRLGGAVRIDGNGGDGTLAELRLPKS
ncbi:MAG TPA: HAMP domain-containing sensor histidine kinase [Rhizomicrobium sp.]|nr:HAMP domain-containing sensor histidine kinase [Rhizomicrobium sp.]